MPWPAVLANTKAQGAETVWLATFAVFIGKKYDFLGTIGFNNPEHYYCSELAVEIYKPWHTSADRLPDVIKPGELYLWGKILYDSLPRHAINTDAEFN